MNSITEACSLAKSASVLKYTISIPFSLVSSINSAHSLFSPFSAKSVGLSEIKATLFSAELTA
jgi:hypothetical protein